MATKTVLITGAGRRLGFFLTEAFLINGWHVIAFTRQHGLQDLHNMKSAKLTVMELNDYSEKEINQAVHSVKRAFSHIDAIIHNASVYEADEFHLNDFYAFYEKLFHVHMRVPAQINFELHTLMHGAKTPGNIIHITDIYAENPNPDYALYCSTKAGLESLSKSFAKKYAPHIRVNSIQPGPIKFLEEHDQQHKDLVMSETLIKSEGGFLPIYKAIISLIDNHYITGTHIKVDGGRSLNRG